MAKRSQKKRRSPETSHPTRAPVKRIFPVDFFTTQGKPILQALLIVAAGFWIYWPALRGDWLWDDDLLITQNPLIHDPTGLWQIWFAPGHLIDYQPIKVSVEWIEWRLWGNDTLGYHLLNVILHLISALLVWRLLSKFGLRLAWLGGLLFAIHPVQVESVAWIAELKNTFSLPPFLLAMCAYLDYDARGKSRDYFLALGLFLVAMLCKATMVMFPVVILLYAWWKRSRIGWNDVKASMPFFAISLTMGLTTVWFLHHAMGESAVPLGSFISRLACAGLSLSFYFSQCLWPVGLLPVYPKWPVDPPSLLQFLPWLIFGGVISWLWTKRTSWGRHVLMGLGFFLINLLPFVGFTGASYMNFTWVMDHILYIPIIGLIGVAMAGLAQVDEMLPTSMRLCGRGILTIVMMLLTLESHGYADLYVNSETLWSYTIKHSPDAWLAYNNLGKALFESGRESEAMANYEQAVRIKPDYAEALNNLGNALLHQGRIPEAIDHYEQSMKLNPHFAETHNNLGDALQQTGHLPEAMDQYEQALQINPNYAEAHYNLGMALQQTGHFPEAMDQYGQALGIRSNYPEAHNNMGNILQQTGRMPEAIDQYEQALQNNPNYAEAHYNLGLLLRQTGRMAEAIDQYAQALRIRPDYAEAHNNMAVALAAMGRVPEAIAQLEAALRIDPNNANARNNLVKLQALQKTTPIKK